jgi:hypothetical protein
MEELENLLDNYNKPDLEVPLEKKFEIAKFNNEIEKCSKEQAIDLAKTAFKCMIINHYSMLQLLKHSWFTKEDSKAV